MDWNWVVYGLAAAGVVASHAVPSHPALRTRAIEHLGRGPYLAAYSGLSLLTLTVFIWAYLRIDSGPWLYGPLPHARTIALALMPLALFLVVGRLTTRAGPVPTGVYCIARSPGSAGVLLWALLHLMNTGDARRVVLFVAMAAIAAIALAKNEWVLRRRARTGDGVARRWLEDGSAAPLVAVLRGRQTLVWAEIGAWRIALALVADAALLWLHPHVFGVDPLAGLRPY